MNNDNLTHGLSNHQTKRGARGRALRPALRRHLTGKVIGFAAALAAAAAISLSLLPTTPAVAGAGAPPAPPQLLSDPFANPPEIRYDAARKRLRGVLQIVSGKYRIPNVGDENMRQYRGWGASQPQPTPAPTGSVPGVSPGPTLRARLGDQMQISFLNKADNSQFSYTTNNESTKDDPPGRSNFGCDTAGLRDASGKFQVYPASDKFPNCFHGSSTANVHYHGTHASPDGVGDNVLVMVIPDPKQRDWTPIFNQMFDSGKVPQKWSDMPQSFRDEQMALIVKNDAEARAEAAKNNLRAPSSLAEKNEELIAAGQWPQYFYGAFPNFWEIPDYDSGNYKAGQAPGTHWYHAHKHGSTSLHILNGLAGAFIIESNREGGYDHVIRKFYGWGDSYGDHEKIFVFQQYDPNNNLERGTNRGKGIKQVLINGKLTPTITMRPGEVQLWRFVNATEGNAQGVITAGTTTGGLFMLSNNAGFQYKQTAMDGVQFSPDNYASQPYLSGTVRGGLVLAGGNRADLLVQAPAKPGTYQFKNGGGGNATLFYVTVAGAAVNQPAPFPTTWATLPKFLEDLRPPGPNDIPNPNSPVKFQWEQGRTTTGRIFPPPPATTPTPVRNPSTPPLGDPPHFMINNKQFGETGDIVDQCMPLDGLQDWVLENYTKGPAHPFHIHINPFQVLKIETPTVPDPTKPPVYVTYTPPNNYIWQDVIAIPSAQLAPDGTVSPGRITIRQTYKDFVGTYVLHCHILAHEDRGMMQLVRVVPLNNYPMGCQNNVPAHH
ncbi:MAG TPA: multicopper oxidase domain-containing protein [Pyrinomonadaceae bacterium]|nr:multicopper oxidase domain-containing protein [Pyrinomonadaceae bacterium]